MFRRLFAVLALLVAFAAPSMAQAQAAPACQYILGFAALHALAPADIGDCVDNQAFAANGDAVQHTTRGLLVWRKADNWTAFTDGYWTWINGPYGLAKRLNTRRFAWEANPNGLPVVAESSTPASAPAPTTSGCVASVQASVKYPQLGGGTQTLYVVAIDANGNPVAGADGSADVQYSTTSRTLALLPTDGSGDTAASWSVGGPRGTVGITVTERAGGCTATGSASFQGRS